MDSHSFPSLRQTRANPNRIIPQNPKSFRCQHQATARLLVSETMAEQNRVVSQQRMIIPNKHGEKLVGVLHSTGSKEVVVLCHGFRSKKEDKTMLKLVDALTSQGISAFHFDFSGNGESEGEFQYGNYQKEADDLHAVTQYLSQAHETCAILGHSKGNVEYRVTEESLIERLNTDMSAAASSIDKECRVLTIHGSSDEVIPVEDALEFSKLIPNHKLHIVEGANHGYSAHQDQLASVVLDFLKSNKVSSCTRETTILFTTF